MLRYAQIHERVRNIAQLGDVVSAMRGVAAARVQQSKPQLASIRIYADIVADAISQVLAMGLSESHIRRNGDLATALVVFGAEHGFAGAFSERILESAAESRPTPMLLIVGSRCLRIARSRGLEPVWNAQMVSQLANAATLADRIGAQLYRQLHAGRIRRVEVVYGRPLEQSGFEVVRQQLLPLDFSRFPVATNGAAPILNLAPQKLLEQLAGEYMFAQLNESITHSFAAENLARLQTMNAARENIRGRLETLTGEERSARQSEITAEIVELAVGAQAASRR